MNKVKESLERIAYPVPGLLSLALRRCSGRKRYHLDIWSLFMDILVEGEKGKGKEVGEEGGEEGEEEEEEGEKKRKALFVTTRSSICGLEVGKFEKESGMMVETGDFSFWL